MSIKQIPPVNSVIITQHGHESTVNLNTHHPAPPLIDSECKALRKLIKAQNKLISIYQACKPPAKPTK